MSCPKRQYKFLWWILFKPCIWENKFIEATFCNTFYIHRKCKECKSNFVTGSKTPQALIRMGYDIDKLLKIKSGDKAFHKDLIDINNAFENEVLRK